MKKILFTIAMVFVMSLGINAQSNADGFFTWNYNDEITDRYTDPATGEGFALPSGHGYDYDSNAPLGTGLLILTALGAGYAIKKKRS